MHFRRTARRGIAAFESATFRAATRAEALMDAVFIYSLLHDACLALDQAHEYAAAAYVDQAMALLRDKYGVGAEVELPKYD
jgi:hypothetical protein